MNPTLTLTPSAYTLLGLTALGDVDRRREQQREHQRYPDQDAELRPLSRAGHSASE